MQDSPLGILRPGGYVVPAARAVIDGVQNQTLVRGIFGKVGAIKKRRGDHQRGLTIALDLPPCARDCKYVPSRQSPWAAMAAAELSTGS